MNLFLENIAKHVSLAPDEQQAVLDKLRPLHVPARSLLLSAGEVCRESYFVTSGILRSYSLDDHANEHVVAFACPGWFIADMYSFLSQRPGQLFIEANVDTEVLALSKANQDKLYAEVPGMERFFRILIENSLVANQQRLIDNLSFTAEARYDKFLHTYPELARQLPQKQIASYLGVTPEFFSKMKARMLRR